VVTAKHY